MSQPIKIALILSGCGVYDGSEILFSGKIEVVSTESEEQETTEGEITFFNDFVEYYQKCANVDFSQACSCGGFDYNEIPEDSKIVVEGDEDEENSFVVISLLKKRFLGFKKVETRPLTVLSDEYMEKVKPFLYKKFKSYSSKALKVKTFHLLATKVE